MKSRTVCVCTQKRTVCTVLCSAPNDSKEIKVAVFMRKGQQRKHRSSFIRTNPSWELGDGAN